MAEAISDEIQMNPVRKVQKIVADIIRGAKWFSIHNVEIIEQDSQALRFLLMKTVNQLKGVSVVVGVDGLRNNYPAIEVDLTITAAESVLVNRAKPNSVTAIDAIQAAIAVVDGEWWQFQSMEHNSSGSGILVATANFKGLVEREFFFD